MVGGRHDGPGIGKRDRPKHSMRGRQTQSATFPNTLHRLKSIPDMAGERRFTNADDCRKAGSPERFMLGIGIEQKRKELR